MRLIRPLFASPRPLFRSQAARAFILAEKEREGAARPREAERQKKAVTTLSGGRQIRWGWGDMWVFDAGRGLRSRFEG